MKSFIDPTHLQSLLKVKPSKDQVRDILEKSLSKKRLDLNECALLLNVEDRDLLDEVFTAAKKVKEMIYGSRIVLFAPLYVGNFCSNDCTYCAFRRSNKEMKRKTLSDEELRKEVEALVGKGQKRVILSMGESPQYDADFIAKTVSAIYSVKKGGEIRRINVNAAPMDVEGYRKIKDVGIGTYQIFQETYHEETYKKVHPVGKKSDFLWRLYGLDRAQEAGIDDVGIGALFGLYEWKFEVMALLAHAIHLEETFHVGPHTISFPRLKEAQNTTVLSSHFVGDEEFKKIIAILRLSVPYTGLILTARESQEMRKEAIELGCSQIDAGSLIKIGGYHEGQGQEKDRQQFQLGDTRSLSEVMRELMETGYIPSFCTACYRLGRTGEHFMEFAVDGFIQNMCLPNALLTLKEYLQDYASEKDQIFGNEIIEKQIERLPEHIREKVKIRLKKIEAGERDLYF